MLQDFNNNVIISLLALINILSIQEINMVKLIALTVGKITQIQLI